MLLKSIFGQRRRNDWTCKPTKISLLSLRFLNLRYFIVKLIKKIHFAIILYVLFKCKSLIFIYSMQVKVLEYIFI